MESKLERFKRILKKKPNKPYTDGSNIYELFNDEVVVLPIDFYGSNRNINRWYHKLAIVNAEERHLIDSETVKNHGHHFLEELSEAWALLDSEYKLYTGDWAYSRENKLSDSDNGSAFTEFISCLDVGYYPRPEVMLAINDCFKHYLSFEGKLSLDEVFFNKPKKGVGNKAAQTKQQDKILQLAIELCLSDESQTQHQIALEVIERLGISDTPESLLRQYRRKIANRKKL